MNGSTETKIETFARRFQFGRATTASTATQEAASAKDK